MIHAPLSIQACLKQASAILITGDHAMLEAEILLAHALDKSRSYLHAWPEVIVEEQAGARLQAYLERRNQGEPIAYITGTKEFWSLPLIVTADTLIPRPETELIIDELLTLLPANFSGKMADLGTGSGAIALALATEFPQAQIDATDISSQALVVARKNAERLSLNQIRFYCSDWCVGLKDTDYNIIVSNPPYLAETEWPEYAPSLSFEPKSALLAGKDGLLAIRTLIVAARTYLISGGILLIEHGYTQAKAVRALFHEAGYHAIQSRCDLAQHERLTWGVYT